MEVELKKKRCYKCREVKLKKDFATNNSRPDGLNSQCRNCQKEYRRQHYLRNKEKIKEQVRKKKQELKDWYINFKSSLSCENCGENRHWCLDFHHEENKDMEVSKLLQYGSKDRILKEISKCKTLCANCHRDLHYKEGFVL